MHRHPFKPRLLARMLLLVATGATLSACVAPVRPYYAGPVYEWPHYHHYYYYR